MLHVDFETYCDIDVREVGAEAYARHPSCEVILMGWTFDDFDVALWEPDGPWDYDTIPDRVLRYLTGSQGPVCAHNVAFEWNIFWHVLGFKLDLARLRDTSALALVRGYPKSLAGAGAALQLDVQKDKRGGLLINRFCTPRKPTKNNPATRNYPWNYPEDWADFCGYCKTDVVVEREIWRKLMNR